MCCKKILIGWLFLSIGLICSFSANAQSRKDLEERRNRLKQEISLTSKMLKETKQNSSMAYAQFMTLQEQINFREQLIATIQQEIEYLESSISRRDEIITALENDIQNIEEDYSRMMRQAYRHQQVNNKWLFILSSKTFNEMSNRWRYLRKYDEYRKKQAQLILDTHESLIKKQKKQELQKLEQESLMTAEIRQQGLLSKELKDKDNLLKNLKRQSADLQQTLNKQKRLRDKLHNQIQAAIQKDIAARETKANNTTGNSSRSTKDSGPKETAPALSGEALSLSNDFRRNKGRLPWPVASGFISGQFGEQPHPLNQQIKIRNTGIDIQTDENSDVLAVFDGEVVSVMYDPSIKNVIMLKHGSYYTVYANVKQIYVSQGDRVTTGQAIGQVDSKNGLPQLHFEVWKERHYQNPTYWIARR